MQQGESKINSKEGAEMVWIPGGEFLMGDFDRPSNPRNVMVVSGYWMYMNVVTVGQYEAFCGATRRKMPESPDLTEFNLDPNASQILGAAGFTIKLDMITHLTQAGFFPSGTAFQFPGAKARNCGRQARTGSRRRRFMSSARFIGLAVRIRAFMPGCAT